ncbi:hypothetical protein AMTR_s00030p00228550 [Amborella trichopoda]|uniref:Uncharacterized protein n=1 Tax=Amborella trichopoda TaxID=13333 RepID=U5D1Q6_AMBTC|nr:hypothetical protein AMTR_s00030p00228550 [Amborella trichopoda]
MKGHFKKKKSKESEVVMSTVVDALGSGNGKENKVAEGEGRLVRSSSRIAAKCASRVMARIQIPGNSMEEVESVDNSEDSTTSAANCVIVVCVATISVITICVAAICVTIVYVAAICVIAVCVATFVLSMFV